MSNSNTYTEFKTAHHHTARHIWEPLAGLGDTDVQLFALAVMHRTGQRRPKDCAQSVLWLNKSAQQHCPAAVAALKAGVDQPVD